MNRHNRRGPDGKFVVSPATLWRRAQDAEAAERGRPLGGDRALRGHRVEFSPAYRRAAFVAKLTGLSYLLSFIGF